jgi:serine phosphatase RsbU (regulator of sigma subunit)
LGGLEIDFGLREFIICTLKFPLSEKAFPLNVEVAVSKIQKYAVSESGDTLEMIERPHGGISFVLVDGQRSGHSAKVISNLVARKAIALLSEGVRDGAAARAAHDYLYTYRRGKVSATLNIASIDTDSNTLVLSRNSHCPIYLITATGVQELAEDSQAVGIYRNTKPVVTELPLKAPTTVVLFTDGLLNAGSRQHQSLNVLKLLQDDLQASGGQHAAQRTADLLFNAAYKLDQSRPVDDISLLVISIVAEDRQLQPGRHLNVYFPINLV